MPGRGMYRATHAVLVDDPEFQVLSACARHIFHVLKISRIGNMAGIFMCDNGEKLTLAKQVGVSIKNIEAGLTELERGGWILREKSVLWLRNALKYDPMINLNNDNHRKAVKKVLEGLPGFSILAKFCNYYELEMVCAIPSRYHLDTISITDTETDTETDLSSGKPDRKHRVSTTNPDHKPAVEYWCKEYEKSIGFKYDFKRGKDAKLISELLKVFTLDQYRYLVDYILTTDDEWIADGRRTLGVLSAMSNNIVQRIKSGSSAKIPKRSKDNLSAIAEYLARRKADDERAKQKQIGGGPESSELDLYPEPQGDCSG